MIGMEELNTLTQSLSPNSRRVYNYLYYILQESFSLENIIKIVEYKKKVIIDHRDIELNKSGFAIELLDAYYICIRASLNKNRRILTLLHEISHILLDHLNIHDIKLRDLSIELAKREGIYHEIRGSSYETSKEYDAEHLATIMYLKIQQCGIVEDLPSIIKKRVLECFKPI